jgi:hypothetical protein
MEAAFSARGTAETPAVLSCYEDIFQRDHWDDLTRQPWWHAGDLDVDRQMLWRREAIANTGEDWFRLPFCASVEIFSGFASPDCVDALTAGSAAAR